MSEKKRSRHSSPSQNMWGKIQPESRFLGALGGENEISIEIEIADRLAGIRRLFRLLHRFLEFLLQQLRSMLLRIDVLAEYRLAPDVLFLHRARRFFHVSEHSWLDGRGVRDNTLRRDVHFHHRPATRTGNVEIGFAFRHSRIIPQSASARREADWEYLEQVQHLPSEHDHRHHHHQDREDLAKTQPSPIGLEMPRPQ